MRRLFYLLLLVPLLAFSGAYPASRQAKGVNYDRLPAGIQFYWQTLGPTDGCTGGEGTAGSTSINTGTYGGAGAANLWAQTNVAGIHMYVRWVCSETSSGVYDDSKLNVIIDQVAAHGGKFALNLIAASYGVATNSNLPSYIYNDNTTYGGSAGHGGEAASGTAYRIRWGNANLITRWKAWIDHMAASYGSGSSRPAQYVYLDEFSSGSGLTLSSVGYATLADEEAGFEGWESYCISAFYPTPCFAKFNFITGDNGAGDAVRTLITDCRDTIVHCNFAQELAMPAPYSSTYPQPAGTTISYSAITNWANLSTGFSSARPRFFNTEYGGSSTWDSTYSPRDAVTFLRYIASLTTPYVASGTPVFYALTATNGINTSSGAWYGMGNLVTSGFLR